MAQLDEQGLIVALEDGLKEGIKMKIRGIKSVLTLVIAILFLAVLVFGINFGAPPESDAQALVKVKTGYVHTIGYVPVLIAIEKGFFKEEGIEVELSLFASGGKMIAPLSTGELDVATGTISAGLFNAIATGANIKVVASLAQIKPGYTYVYLIVRKDLVDSGAIKKVGDLRGKNIAFYAKGIIQDYLFGKMVEEEGLSIKDFDITYLDGPKQVLALESKAIDAAMIGEPWGAIAEAKGVAVRFKTPDQVKATEEEQVTMVMFSGRFIAEKRYSAQKFMNAYVKGSKYYAERGLKNEEVVQILTKYIKLPPEAIRASVPHYTDKDVRLNVKSIENIQDWFYNNGYIKEKAPMDKIIDLSFLK